MDTGRLTDLPCRRSSIPGGKPGDRTDEPHELPSETSGGAVRDRCQLLPGRNFAGKKDWANALTGYEERIGEIVQSAGKNAIVSCPDLIFELKNYNRAETLLRSAESDHLSQENKLEAMRGLCAVSINYSNGPRQRQRQVSSSTPRAAVR